MSSSSVDSGEWLSLLLFNTLLLPQLLLHGTSTMKREKLLRQIWDLQSSKVSKEDLPTISVPWPWDLSFLPLPGSLESFSGSSLNPSKEKINLKTKLSRNASLAFHAALPVGKDSSNSLVNKLTLELPLPEKPSSLPVNPPSSPSCPTKSVTCWLRVLEDCSSLSVLLVSLSLLLLLVIKSSLESKSSEKLSLEPLPQPSFSSS